MKDELDGTGSVGNISTSYYLLLKQGTCIFFLFMEILLWHDLCSTNHILFFKISAVKNSWVVARVKKTRRRVTECKKLSLRNETQYMELSEICYCLKILYNLQELKKKISEYLIFLIKWNYQNKQNRMKVLWKYIFQ